MSKNFLKSVKSVLILLFKNVFSGLIYYKDLNVEWEFLTHLWYKKLHLNKKLSTISFSKLIIFKNSDDAQIKK